MPRKKRKQTVADCGSSKDTMFRRVAAFLPLLVPVRQGLMNLVAPKLACLR